MKAALRILVLLLLSSIAGAQIGGFDVTPIQLHSHISSTLVPGTGTYQGRPINVYEFNLARHEDVKLALSSQDFDPYLYLLDRQTNALYGNDDSRGHNAALELSLKPGHYWVGVSSRYGQDLGDYHLDIEGERRSIHFFMGPQVAVYLRNEISEFARNVERDTGAEVKVLESPQDPFELRRLLREAWLNEGLTGAFFIGLVPVVYMQNDDILTEVRRLSDEFYRALDCPYRPGDLSGIALERSYYSIIARCHPNIWVSRIKSPLSGGAAIEQIRDYLEKNALYRNSRIRYKDNMLFQAAIPREERRDYTTELPEVFASHPLYAPSQVELIQLQNAQLQKTEFLAALTENFELLKLNIHGASTFVQFQGLEKEDSVNLYVSELRNADIRAKVIEFESCNVGNFARRGYFAGEVLFNSDALLIKANPNPTFYTDTAILADFSTRYRAYGYGKSFAEVYLHTYSGSAPHFFGDPTVRLNDEVLPDARPVLELAGRIFVNPFEFSLDVGPSSEGPVRRALVLRNMGDEELVVQGVHGGQFPGGYFPTSILVNGQKSLRGSNGFIFQLDQEQSDDVDRERYTLTLAPGETKEITFIFNPAANLDDPGNALYTGIFQFATNDPTVAAFVVRVQGSHAQGGEPFVRTHGAASDGSVTASVFGGGVSADGWKSSPEHVPAGSAPDVGGVIVVDERHVGKSGNLYAFVRIEGIGWYHQDRQGRFSFLGKNYEPEADASLARHAGIDLESKHVMDILREFDFQAKGLGGLDFELKLAYSLSGEDVLYSHDRLFAFEVE